MEEGFCQCGCGRKTNIISKNNVKRGLVKDKYFRFVAGHNRKQYKELNWNDLINEYQNGFSVDILSGKYHVPKTTVNRYFRIMGINKRTSSETQVIMHQKGFREILSGSKHPSWKGGRKAKQGYIQLLIPKHPRADSNGYVMEHLYIWEKIYGKSLPNGYCIHHLNGVRNDNRPENLVALKRGEHASLAEPYKKRIRELEKEMQKLKQPTLSFNKENVYDTNGL
jgi:hypothetical protein